MKHLKDNPMNPFESKYETKARQKEVEKKRVFGNLLLLLPLIFMILFTDSVTTEYTILFISSSIIGFLAFIDLIRKLDEVEFLAVAKSALYTLATSFLIVCLLSLLDYDKNFTPNGTYLFTTLWAVFLIFYLILKRKNKTRGNDYE